jgi:methylmalonyl-CoA mutase N-terminal domain/subunit
MAAAIRSGWVQREIDAAIARRQQEIERKEKIVVGVNAFCQPAETETPGGVHRPPAGQGERLAEAVRRLRATRDARAVQRALRALGECAGRGERENLLPAMIEAARAYATVGEMMGVVRQAWGLAYDPLGVLQSPRDLAA